MKSRARDGCRCWQSAILRDILRSRPATAHRAVATTILVRWLSGRKQRFAKAPYPKRVPRVRIPPSPFPKSHRGGVADVQRRKQADFAALTCTAEAGRCGCGPTHARASEKSRETARRV